MEKLYLFGTDIDKNIGEGESCWVMMNKIHEEADCAGPALVQAETGERRRKTTTRQLYFLTLFHCYYLKGESGVLADWNSGLKRNSANFWALQKICSS